ncbi:hypothetical protein B0J11DRAFT_516014 [Dendryphion nanum]|uniref:Uncharacterized protein n=1 Tax=Dendryphion nanum TaxID=256645 RepID=A0A9P9EKD0_9PLEO|nr:hypothetical protein B0J11DRAFT_516014 [Dendryphion nanum]
MEKASYSPLNEDEEQSEQYGHSLRKPTARSRFARSPIFYVVDVILVLAVGFLLFRRHSHEKIQQFDLNSDITGYAPQIDHRLVTFTKQPYFISNHSSLESLREAREHWKTLVPPGQGFVRLDEERAKNRALPKPIKWTDPTKDGSFYGTAIVHSIHCLYSIMAEYDALALGLKSKQHDTLHMDHCFDYIRQSLMCAGDTTLAGEDFPGGSYQFEVVHVCRNWDQIYDWLDENRPSDKWQFGEEELSWVPPD